MYRSGAGHTHSQSMLINQHVTLGSLHSRLGSRHPHHSRLSSLSALATLGSRHSQLSSPSSLSSLVVTICFDLSLMEGPAARTRLIGRSLHADDTWLV